MAKHIPIDAEGTRFLGSGPVRWRWLLPWCCWSCRRHGEVDVDVEPTKRSTDDQVDERVDRDHFDVSPMCISRRFQRGARVYRYKNGEKLYLRFPNEKEHEVKAEPWPPWRE